MYRNPPLPLNKKYLNKEVVFDKPLFSGYVFLFINDEEEDLEIQRLKLLTKTNNFFYEVKGVKKYKYI